MQKSEWTTIELLLIIQNFTINLVKDKGGFSLEQGNKKGWRPHEKCDRKKPLAFGLKLALECFHSSYHIVQ